MKYFRSYSNVQHGVFQRCLFIKKITEIPVLQMEVGVVTEQEYTVPVKDVGKR